MSKMQRFADWKDLAAMLVRRKWWVVSTATFLSLGTLFVALMLPPIYVSETLILIEPRDVPDDFVKDLISVDSDRRLAAIRETVLSRSNLLSVYREFSSRLGDLARLNVDGRLDRLRRKIDINFERPDRREPIHYFRIKFEDESPETAQLITRRLAELFISYDSQTREEQVFGTGRFLEGELDKVNTELEAADQRLAELKRRYQNELPEQLETNLRTLDRLEQERRTNAEALDRSRSSKLTLERQLAETPAVIVEPVTPSRPQLPRQVSPLVETYREKQQAYQDLTARYTDKHPDVRRAKEELELLRAEIPPEDFVEMEEAKSGFETRTLPNPLHQSLLAQLQEVKTEIDIRERAKQRIENQIRVLSGRVANTPRRELELANAKREFDDLKKRYDDLRGKMSETDLAVSLESRQKGEQFRVVDPASLPLSPAKPNRLLIVLIGLAASIVLGAGLAVGRDLVDHRLWTHAEIERFFEKPVLAEIPQILEPHELRRLRFQKAARVAVFGVVALLGVLAIATIYSTPDLRAWSAQKLERLSLVVNR